jgi:hypothetical protein
MVIHVAIFRRPRYAASQRTWTRKPFRVALPAADPPDNHKKRCICTPIPRELRRTGIGQIFHDLA